MLNATEHHLKNTHSSKNETATNMLKTKDGKMGFKKNYAEIIDAGVDGFLETML